MDSICWAGIWDGLGEQEWIDFLGLDGLGRNEEWIRFDVGHVKAVSDDANPIEKIITSTSTGFTELVFSVSSTRSRAFDSRAVAGEQWASRALGISSFVTLRLGVFVLALVLMGRILLPKPEKKVKQKSNETESSSDHCSVASSLNASKHSFGAYGSSMEVITE